MCLCFFSFGVWRYALFFFSRLLFFFKENRDCDYRGVRVEGIVDGVRVVIVGVVDIVWVQKLECCA